jgi:hypothetical protein
MSTLQARSTDSAAHQDIYDVFLSHHSGDKSLVESIAARLMDEQGLRPFLDKWHLIPGEPWQEALEEALDRSTTCAVFLGPGGLGPWENEEMRAALDERVRNKSFRVIPVLLPGAEPKDERTLPRFLRRLTWVDFRGGLDDPDTFQSLVAGIRGVPPGPPSAPTTPAITPARTAWRTLRRLRNVFSSIFADEGKSRTELWKIVLPAVLALLLSTPFIGAAIPKYKLQIKSPAFRKEGVYEALAGTVLIKWEMTKEQWFRETDVGDIKANVVVKKFGDEKDRQFPGAPGELKLNLESGKYEVRIDATEYGRSETIALQVTPPNAGEAVSATYLRGFVTDKSGKGVDGAEVEVREILGQPILNTTTTDDGGFNLSNIPARFGDRARVIVRVKGVEKYNYYHTLPGPIDIRLEK